MGKTKIKISQNELIIISGFLRVLLKLIQLIIKKKTKISDIEIKSEEEDGKQK